LASSLFLLAVSLLSLRLLALLADTDETGLRASVTELAVSVLGGLVVGDGALLELGGVLDGKDSGGVADNALLVLGGLDLLGGSVTLLGLAVAAGENDEALAVFLETLDVGLEAFLGQVLRMSADPSKLLTDTTHLAARVHGDTNGASKLAGNASSLQLNQGETTAGPYAAVVCMPVSLDLPSIIISTYT
jgi:hypothetical protein